MGRKKSDRRKALDKKFPIYRDCEGKSIKCQAPCCKRAARHIHHIVPRSQGGTDAPENLMHLCDKCHRAIHSKNGDFRAWGSKGGKSTAARAKSIANLKQFKAAPEKLESFFEKRADTVLGIDR